MHPHDLELHHPFLRRLAASLVRDEHIAEDLVQETWLKALTARVRDPRAFLARVLRNLASNEHKTRERRTRRERLAARQESVDPERIDDELDRLDAVLRCVRELPEPFRTAIFLRYYRDLTPTRIAEQLDEPLPTVKSRLARAKALLRKALDERHGTRRAWVLPLAAFTPRDLPQAFPTTGAIAMGAKAKLAVAVAAVAGLAVWMSDPDTESTPEATGEIIAAGGALDAPPLETEGGTHATPERDRAAAAPASVAHAQPVASATPVDGRAFFADGRPAAGVRVGFVRGFDFRETPLVTALSDGRGHFRVPRALGRGILVGADPAHDTVAAGLVAAAERSTQSVLVLAPRIALAGRVVDSSGAALANATVRAVLPDDFRSRFPVRLDRTRVRRPETASDGRGEFSIELGRVGGAHLLIERPGYEPSRIELAAGATGGLVVTLHEKRTLRWIRGTVVDARGAPVAGARVSFGAEVVRSDAAGSFRLPLDRESGDFRGRTRWLGKAPKVLVALAPGHGPGRYAVPVTDGVEQWPPAVTLRLGPPPLTIRGRVVDHGGRPVRARVWIDDPQFFTALDNIRTVECTLAGRPGTRWLDTGTKPDGSFEIPGLLPRRYRIGAVDARTLHHAYVDGVQAGTNDIVVRLDGRDAVRVAGRLVSLAGHPVTNATVRVLLEANRIRHGDSVLRTSTLSRGAVAVDEAGRFVLTDMPPAGVDLYVEGAEIFRARFRRLEFAADRELRLEVALRVHVKLQLADRTEADSFGVLDQRGAMRRIFELGFKGTKPTKRAPIRDGRTEVYAVREDVTQVVLFRDGRETRRMAVDLVPGRVNELQY